MTEFTQRLSALTPAQRELFAILDRQVTSTGQVAGAAHAPADTALLSIRPEGTGVPLYCVHPVTGVASQYRVLARLLPAAHPLHAFEMPDVDDERSPASVVSVEELARRYAATLQEHCSTPYVLLGWSAGGLIAFEMARRLVEAGLKPRHLIVVDAPPPIEQPRLDEQEVLQLFVADLVGRRFQAFGGSPALRSASNKALEPAALLACVRDVGILDIDGEHLHRRYMRFRANVRAVRQYRSRWQFPGPITLLRAADSVELRTTWLPFALDVEEHEIPGNHYSIWDRANLPVLSALIRRKLA